MALVHISMVSSVPKENCNGHKHGNYYNLNFRTNHTYMEISDDIHKFPNVFLLQGKPLRVLSTQVKVTDLLPDLIVSVCDLFKRFGDCILNHAAVPVLPESDLISKACGISGLMFNIKLAASNVAVCTYSAVQLVPTAQDRIDPNLLNNLKFPNAENLTFNQTMLT
jgi:hypothetical protein